MKYLGTTYYYNFMLFPSVNGSDSPARKKCKHDRRAEMGADEEKEKKGTLQQKKGQGNKNKIKIIAKSPK